MCRVFEMENSFVNSTLFCSVSAMPESSAWQDICRWEFCPEHEDDDDDDDDIDQGRIGGDLFSLLITSASFLMSVFPNDIQRNPLYGSIWFNPLISSIFAGQNRGTIKRILL